MTRSEGDRSQPAAPRQELRALLEADGWTADNDTTLHSPSRLSFVAIFSRFQGRAALHWRTPSGEYPSRHFRPDTPDAVIAAAARAAETEANEGGEG